MTPQKILVIRLGAMGDLIHVSPSVLAVKAQYPDCDIHWLTAPGLLPLVESFEGVSRIWAYDKKTGLAGWWQLMRALKKENFDAVVNLHPSLKTQALCLFLNAARTGVYKKEKLKATGREQRSLRRLHAIEDFFRPFKEALALSGEAGKPILNLAGETQQKNVIGIIPGVGDKRANRAWPAERYAALIRLFQAEHPETRWMLFGGPDDVASGQAIIEALPTEIDIENTCGRLALLETARAMQTCVLIVGADTGPTHLAAALGIPVVSPFGPTSVARTGPRGRNSITVVTPDEALESWPCELPECVGHTPCIEGISVEAMWNALAKQLG